MNSNTDQLHLLYALPGLEMAVNSLVDQINQIRHSLGQPPMQPGSPSTNGHGQGNGQSNGQGQKQSKTKKTRSMSDAVRAAISAAQIARWKGHRKIDKHAQKEKLDNVDIATILQFAREHDGILDSTEIKQAYPGKSLRLLGNALRNGRLIRTRTPHVFRLGKTK